MIKKTILLTLLIVIVGGVFAEIAWSYHNLEVEIGATLAQTAISYHVFILLGMVAAGVGLGCWIDRLMRKRQHIFQSPQKGSWMGALMNLWGHQIQSPVEEPATESEPVSATIASATELPEIKDLPTRRGRKPTFPLKRWLPIAAQWENRDPIRDAFTLGELISEHLGTNSDGSPIVSEQTYYSIWRPRAVAELRRLAKVRKAAGKQKPEKPREQEQV